MCVSVSMCSSQCVYISVSVCVSVCQWHCVSMCVRAIACALFVLELVFSFQFYMGSGEQTQVDVLRNLFFLLQLYLQFVIRSGLCGKCLY